MINFEIFYQIFPNCWTLVQIFLYFWKALKTNYKWQNFAKCQKRPKFKNEKSCGWSKFVSDSDFLEIDKLCSAYIDVFGNPWKGLQATKIFWAEAQKQKNYSAMKFWNSVPIFFKFVNFALYILALLESPRKVLQDTQILSPKSKNKKVIKGKVLTMISIFSKLIDFGPHISTL